MAETKDYNGQPRKEDGRFGRGKQNGNRSKNRSLGAKPSSNTAGLFEMPPVYAPKPKYKPGEGRMRRG